MIWKNLKWFAKAGIGLWGGLGWVAGRGWVKGRGGREIAWDMGILIGRSSKGG